ncbi:hypothetical protein ACFQS1_18480 [Paractinoplanes rhizophilus]|uniref:Uncharacterized protein n=1 Tax=Paractinoplanes rhizophilus TaxID=1416877 RepID=A0ABW2HWK5_9ACTN
MTCSISHAMPYCSSAPTGSDTRASASRPAPTTPSVPSTQLLFCTPCAMSSMSSASQTPAQADFGCSIGPETSGLVVIRRP